MMFMQQTLKSETDNDDPVFGKASVIVKLGETITEEIVQSVVNETGVVHTTQRGGSQFSIHGSWDALAKARQLLVSKYEETDNRDTQSSYEAYSQGTAVSHMTRIKEELSRDQKGIEMTEEEKVSEVSNPDMTPCETTEKTVLDECHLRNPLFLNEKDMNKNLSDDCSEPGEAVDSEDPADLTLDIPGATQDVDKPSENGVKSENIVQSNNIDESENMECTTCKEIFPNKTDLHEHLKIKHWTFTCPICSKTFLQKRYLHTHLKRHSREKKHRCDICGWKFLEKNKLKLHLETHKSVEDRNLPYRCSLCGKQFSNRSGMGDHMNTHTGNRPYKCEEPGCDATFRHRVGLHRHMITHTREKPFTCSICSKSFGFKSKLDSHMTIHSGMKKNSCLCGKVYTVSSSLKRHQEVCKESQAKLNQHSFDMSDVLRPDSISQVLVTNADLLFMCGHCEKVFDSLEKVQAHTACHEPVTGNNDNSNSTENGNANTPYHQIVICRDQLT